MALQGHHGAARLLLSHEAGHRSVIPEADAAADLRNQLHAIVFCGNRPLQGHSRCEGGCSGEPMVLPLLLLLLRGAHSVGSGHLIPSIRVKQVKVGPNSSL